MPESVTQKVFLLQLIPNDFDKVAQQVKALNEAFLIENDLTQIEQLTPNRADGPCYVLFIGKPRKAGP